MGGGDISKVEKTMAKKFGMKPINKEKLLQKKGSKGSPSLGGRSSSQRQRPSSARVRKVKPLVGGGGSMTTDGNEDGEDISIISTRVSQGAPSRRRHGKGRPQSAAPSRRSAKSTSGRMRPSSSTGKRKSKKNQGGSGSGGSSGKLTKTKAPDMSIESIRARHNEQLLRVLEQEQEQEERRERILRGIKVRVVFLVLFLNFSLFFFFFILPSDTPFGSIFYSSLRSSLHFSCPPGRRGEEKT